jgi:hypothetical protein
MTPTKSDLPADRLFAILNRLGHSVEVRISARLDQFMVECLIS